MQRPLHYLLSQQLEKLGLDNRQPPSGQTWQLFLHLVDHHYRIHEHLEKSRNEDPTSVHSAHLAKQTFITNIGHELRTPLTSIISCSDVLEALVAGQENDSISNLIDKIQASAQYLMAIVNDILDLSRLEAGDVQLNRETFEIRELVDRTVDAIKADAIKHGNEIRIDCQLSHPRIYSDREKVAAILLNLLSNAAKFTKNGRIQVSVRNEKDSSGIRWVLFQVIDTGIGIPSSQIDKLFTPFYQVDTSTTREHGGTGLGLAISRRFCEMLGGQMSVESQLGAGSTFTARLPLFKRTALVT